MRYKIMWKLLIPLIVTIMALTVALGCIAYKMSLNGAIKQGGGEALSLGALALEVIDEEDVKRIRETSDPDSHLRIDETVKRIIDKTNLQYIYMIGEVDGKYRYLYDYNEIENVGKALEEYYYEETENAFQGESYYLEEIESSNYGNIISAYLPIYQDENLIGVIGVDYDATQILHNAANTRQNLITIGIILMLFALLIFVIIISGMVNELNKLNEKLIELVSSNGDLTKTVVTRSKDEIGKIAGNINSLLAFILEVIRNIAKGSLEMNQSIENSKISIAQSVGELKGITSSTEKVNAMVEETYSNMENITDVIGNMKQQLVSVYTDLKSGKELIDTITCKAEDIYEKSSVEGDEIRVYSEKINGSLQEKISKASEVSKIEILTTKILEIADQTRLLALNASIEAARAGESGRGFTIVAEEISILSKDTAKTATEIKEINDSIIRTVHELSQESGKIMSYVKETTMGMCEQQKRTGKEYAESAKSVSEFIASMNAKSELMEQGMTHVMANVESVLESVGQCADGINQVSQMTSTLMELMEENEQQALSNEKLMDSMKAEVDKFIIE